MIKRFLRFLTHKVTIIAFLALFQIVIFFVVVLLLNEYTKYFLYVSNGLSFLLVILILKSDEPTVYKVSWVIPMIIAPIFGGLFYLTFKPITITRKHIKRVEAISQFRKLQMASLVDNTHGVKSPYDKQINNIQSEVYPHYENTEITFLESGAVKLEHVINELKNAKKFIFMEYFILEETGQIWKTMYPILLEKVKEGLDVRLIYDDFGSSIRINKGFRRRMEKAGIKTVTFNPMKLRFNVSFNYRDHKKIIVIDGDVGFTGGINMADEYANIKKRFGHWHDAAIMLKGDAVYSLTASFIESWDLHRNTTTLLEPFKPIRFSTPDGIIVPFTDSPLDQSYLSKNVYTQMIYSACKDIYITTPYFIIDEDMLNAFKIQALGGVKIHIIIPAIPDKKMVFTVTEYYLKQLVKFPNVYIHSYTPGFIHSKIMLVDGEVATVGTCNFDFRSFYLHYENTVWIYQSKALESIQTFMEDTIRKSKQLIYSDLHKSNIFFKIYESMLVALSHLL